MFFLQLTVDKDELMRRNLTDNLDKLRKHQLAVKFKATATVLIAAKRFKRSVKRKIRARMTVVEEVSVF
jgi:hypothetical protein